MDGQVKLTRLLQYTTGPAKMAIKTCALIGGDAGYTQARDILKNRYGNSHLVSQMIISDLKNGKRITKANELQQLGGELSTALTETRPIGKVCRAEYSAEYNRHSAAMSAVRSKQLEGEGPGLQTTQRRLPSI